MLDKLVDIIPPRYRRWLYLAAAVYGVAQVVVPVVVAVTRDGWQWTDLDQIMIGLGITGVGSVAAANTPTTPTTSED